SVARPGHSVRIGAFRVDVDADRVGALPEADLGQLHDIAVPAVDERLIGPGLLGLDPVALAGGHDVLPVQDLDLDVLPAVLTRPAQRVPARLDGGPEHHGGPADLDPAVPIVPAPGLAGQGSERERQRHDDCQSLLYGVHDSVSFANAITTNRVPCGRTAT